MTPELVAYPFLFVAIFFESFVLVTLLSRPARAARARGPSSETPTVTVIVPCFNEETTVANTCESLLALEYPADKLEVILVNDGSTDRTREAMERFAGHAQVRIVHKENGGKHTALNAGIALSRAEFIGCLDADSFVESDALRELMPFFAHENVAAVTATMFVHEPRTIIEHMQNAEYSFGAALRHAVASINGLYVTPGPFSFYRRSVLDELGGFRYGHQTEDMEMALRIQRAGYGIENAPRACVYTKAPHTLPLLIRQRVRWTTGFLRNVLGEYRGLVMDRSHPALGMVMLPNALVAVGSGILLFTLAIFQFARHTAAAVQVRAGIPLSYILTPQSASSFDWFYLPANLLFLLGVTAALASFFLIGYGKYLAKTRINMPVGLLSYVLLYGFIAPLWLLRSTADIILGKHRLWR